MNIFYLVWILATACHANSINFLELRSLSSRVHMETVQMRQKLYQRASYVRKYKMSKGRRKRLLQWLINQF